MTFHSLQNYKLQLLANDIRGIKHIGMCCCKKIIHLRVVTVTSLCVGLYPTILLLLISLLQHTPHCFIPYILTILGLYTFQTPCQSRSNINIMYCYRPLVQYCFVLISVFLKDQQLLYFHVFHMSGLKKLLHGLGVHYSARGCSSSSLLLSSSGEKSRIDKMY